MKSETQQVSFKKQLALVFDEDFSTKPFKWNHYLDILIIGMIVLGTTAVFLETIPLSEGFRKGLRVFDWIVQIFFTLEVSLRIWAADEIDPKYKGFLGRVRYCFSFYGLIDFLATYPLWLGFAFPTLMSAGLFQCFRVLRVARLFRVFRYRKAFRFLGEAIRSKKRELLVSLEFLVIITLVLSFILYLVEHNSNPDIADGWKSFVWAFAKYIGDPGKVADMALATPAGQVIAFLIGILGIAIFAVPIGLLSSGFSDAMEQEKRSEEIADYRERIRTYFRRSGDKALREYLNSLPDCGGERFKTLNFVPQRRLVSQLQVLRGLTLNDVIETCNTYDEFRLKNLSAAISDEDLVADRFIVEFFPLNRPYGCFIPRQSNVTIVSPYSRTEVGIGWFSYYLARMGGFNYISKEIEVDPTDGDSYYNMKPEPPQKEQLANREAFLHDVYEASRSGWVIFIVHHLKNSVNPADFHLVDRKKNGSEPTVIDQEAYQRFTERFTARMKEDFELETAIQSSRYPLLKNNLGYVIRKKNPETNCFVLRPSSELVNFNTRKLAIAFAIAQLLSQEFDNGRGMTDEDWADFKKKGIGFTID